MTVLNICGASFGSNCYCLISDTHALVIDPSASSEKIIETVSAHGAVIDGILLTHGHFDHIISLDKLRQMTGAPAIIHKDDAIMLTDGSKNAFYDFFGKERTYLPAEKTLEDGDTLRVGAETLHVLHTPGHTQGSICILVGEIIFTGDTLFAESFGRCDLWGGDISKMRASLRRLRELDGSLTIYAGHGESCRLSDALDNVAYLI